MGILYPLNYNPRMAPAFHASIATFCDEAFLFYLTRDSRTIPSYTKIDCSQKEPKRPIQKVSLNLQRIILVFIHNHLRTIRQNHYILYN